MIMQNEEMGYGMKDSVILDKTMDFSVRIVNLYKYLNSEKKEYVLSRQLLRCGTSIGANAHEAHNGQSKKDFIAKMYIALKEASEAEYWLILLTKTCYLTSDQSESLLSDCIEIKKILTSIIRTARSSS